MFMPEYIMELIKIGFLIEALQGVVFYIVFRFLFIFLDNIRKLRYLKNK